MSDRTVTDYRGYLKRQGIAYQHPAARPDGANDVWTLDPEALAERVETHYANSPTANIHEILGPYPIDLDEYDELVAQAGLKAAETDR